MSDTKQKGPTKATDAPEPALDAMIRFEAGHIDELVAFMKTWVEWRLTQTAAVTKDSGAVKIGGGAINY